MKIVHREYPLLAMCGLSCGLCTMHLGGYCPGCGGGDGKGAYAGGKRGKRQRGNTGYGQR